MTRDTQQQTVAHQPLRLVRCVWLAGIAWLVCSIGVSAAEAGFVHVGSVEESHFSQVETDPVKATAATQKSPSNPIRHNLLTLVSRFSDLQQGSTTSTSSSQSTSSNHMLPASLPFPMDEPPALCSRYNFLHSVLSSQMFPSGIFRPPRFDLIRELSMRP